MVYSHQINDKCSLQLLKLFSFPCMLCTTDRVEAEISWIYVLSRWGKEVLTFIISICLPNILHWFSISDLVGLLIWMSQGNSSYKIPRLSIFPLTQFIVFQIVKQFSANPIFVHLCMLKSNINKIGSNRNEFRLNSFWI